MTQTITKDQFQTFVEEVFAQRGCKKPLAFGVGVGTVSGKENLLEVFYPTPHFQSDFPFAAIFYHLFSHLSGNNSYVLTAAKCKEALSFCSFLEREDRSFEEQILRAEKSSGKILVTILTEDLPPKNTEEAYLKLSLLSHCLVSPNQIDLNNIFSVLPTVAWTSEGAIDPEELSARILEARLSGHHLEVYSLDKFPKLTNYLAPSKVRIADGARVRLGAYLGEGTTVMHEGFVNFNAGTEGPNMVEGRISAGVFVGSGSDLGGGSSTMGTLSGGNEVKISVGKKCLIGANAGTGIPLGDNCIIEAGLYLTAATKVHLCDGAGKMKKTIKASELAFTPNLLFRRNSLSGAVEALPNKKAIELNTELHHTN